MVDPTSLITLLKAAPSIYKGGKWVYEKITIKTPIKGAIEKAIELTAQDYPDASDTVENALRKLLASDAFSAAIETAEIGKEIIADEKLADILIEKGGFYTGINTSSKDALKVIQSFSHNLKDELLRSSDSQVYFARQERILHQETLEAVNDGNINIRSKLLDIERKVDLLNNPIVGQKFEPDSAIPIQEKIYQDRIQTANDLLQEGKTDSAKSILSKLRRELNEQDVSKELWGSIAGNLGLCALRANDPQTAWGEFTEALRLKPDSLLTQSYLASTALFLGKNELAKHYAELIAKSAEKTAFFDIKNQEKTSLVSANYIRVLFGLDLSEDFEKFIAENYWVQEDSQCALIIGMARYEQSRFDEAEKYFQIAAKNPLLSPLAKLLESQSIGHSIYKQYEDNPPLDWRMPTQVKERLAKAENQLLEVQDIFSQHDSKTNYVEALIHLSNIQRMLLKLDEATNSCSKALAVDPNHIGALWHQAHLLLFRNDSNAALQLLLKIPADSIDKGLLAVPMARAHVSLGQFGKAIDLLEPLLDLTQADKLQIDIANLLLTSWSSLKENEKASDLKRKLLNLRKDDPRALIVIARQIDREGAKEEALKLLENGLEKCQSNRERDIVTIELAEMSFAGELWGMAASLYEKVINTSQDTPTVRKYLFALFRAGTYATALKLAQKLRGQGEPIHFVSEIEARILEWIGDIQPALGIYESLAKQEPTQWGYKFSQIMILSRQRDSEKAKEVLLSIDYEDIKDQPDALIKTAALRQKLGLGDELKYAWRARRKGFTQSKIHSKYVGIFLQRSEDNEGSLNVLNGAQINCAVKLLNSKTQERKDYIIEAEAPDPTRDEISPEDLKAQALLGAKQEETIVFNQGDVTETSWIVEEVQSKYVYGFQQSMLKYQSWFNDSAIVSIHIGNPEKEENVDFSGVFKMLDRSQERGQKILEIHNEHVFPLGGLAELKGKNIFDIWSSFLGSSQKLYVTPGDFRLMEQEEKLLKSADAIVLDLTGLLTLQYLDLLHHLPKLFAAIFVPRHIVDEVEEWANDIFNNKAVGWAAKGEDSYIFQEFSEVDRQKQEEFLEKIRTFVREICEIVPASAALTYSQEKVEEITRITGISSFASIMVSIEKNLPLYCDDFGLRRVGSQLQPTLNTCGIQTILLKMKDRGIISSSRYNEALWQLIMGSYFYISVNPSALWWICERYEKKPSPEINHILKRQLQGPHTDYLSALIVVAHFIRKVWLEVTDKEDKMQIIDMTIDAVVSGRDLIPTKADLKNVLVVVFRHYKSPLPILFARIDNWSVKE